VASRRSIGFPVTLGIVLTIVALALAIGWQILVFSDARAVARELTTLDWVLFVLGSVSFGLIISGLLWLCLWLVREMRLNQRQRAFLDAVTHEMKTPLASLRLYVDTFERHDPDRQHRREFLGRMHDDLERLDQTVDQVLTAARSEDPGRKAKRESVPLGALLQTCVEEVCERHDLPPAAVQLEVGPAETVYGNPNELSVVFRNLIENAVKYSDEPVEVQVRVRTNGGDRIDVDISDRGIGIPPVELRKIFQRFYRVGRDVQRTASGLGLGLFIVRNLVRRQGGRVVARSEGSGQGSRFVVTLRRPPMAA
jgi:two-component system phosphate regulon sensor histidine kinase PhoR